MRMRRCLWVLLPAAAVAGAAIGAPAPARRHGSTIGDIAERLRAGGADGRELVDAAMAEVCAAFPYDSVWHLWETPAKALASGRGWSHQYNTILLRVLRLLGFEARLVHAARVRGWRRPWFFTSHTWVKVRLDGRWVDACASRTGNHVGDIGFVPVSDELPYRGSTRYTVPLALAPFVVAAVWRARLGGRDVPDWVYHPRG